MRSMTTACAVTSRPVVGSSAISRRARRPEPSRSSPAGTSRPTARTDRRATAAPGRRWPRHAAPGPCAHAPCPCARPAAPRTATCRGGPARLRSAAPLAGSGSTPCAGSGRSSRSRCRAPRLGQARLAEPQQIHATRNGAAAGDARRGVDAGPAWRSGAPICRSRSRRRGRRSRPLQLPDRSSSSARTVPLRVRNSRPKFLTSSSGMFMSKWLSRGHCRPFCVFRWPLGARSSSASRQAAPARGSCCGGPASLRLRCDARSGVASQNSLRSLRSPFKQLDETVTKRAGARRPRPASRRHRNRPAGCRPPRSPPAAACENEYLGASAKRAVALNSSRATAGCGALRAGFAASASASRRRSNDSREPESDDRASQRRFMSAFSGRRCRAAHHPAG